MLAATSSSAAGAPASELVEPRPEWVSKPSADALSEAYPAKALEAKVEGKAVLHCTLTPDGLLRPCKVLSETPAGFGFGQAALSVAPDFRMTPLLYSAGDRSVRVPISFEMPTEEPVEPPPYADAATGAAWAFLLLCALALVALSVWTVRRERAPVR